VLNGAYSATKMFAGSPAGTWRGSRVTKTARQPVCPTAFAATAKNAGLHIRTAGSEDDGRIPCIEKRLQLRH
jgi:hypothetical protein